MIIVNLRGGLGNQLFQYALGLRLSLMKNVVLKLDIFSYEKNPWAQYDLKHFNIEENLADQNELKRFRINSISKKILNKLRNQFKSYYSNKNVKEIKSIFDPEIFKVPNDVYLTGYWQSEKYFKDIEDIIREKFTVKYGLFGENIRIADMINNQNSVSLHVRRGQYVIDPSANRVHGTMDINYYKKCISFIAKKIENPHFFIFSDDIKWVKANLSIEYPTTYVDDIIKNKNYDDMRLMSMFKHNIIANSTFSWWGAWLNRNPNKIVIAPKKWFKDPIRNQENDIVPDSWIKI